jgi:hypothetical protein
MAKFSCIILRSRYVEMLAVSAVSFTFTLQPVKPILYMFSIISSLVNSMGRPLRGSSFVLVRAILYAGTLHLTVG